MTSDEMATKSIAEQLKSDLGSLLSKGDTPVAFELIDLLDTGEVEISETGETFRLPEQITGLQRANTLFLITQGFSNKDVPKIEAAVNDLRDNLGGLGVGIPEGNFKTPKDARGLQSKSFLAAARNTIRDAVIDKI
ncbi:MAG: hypothetical protein AAB443_03465 [Patescibacteria group bacterium]